MTEISPPSSSLTESVSALARALVSGVQTASVYPPTTSQGRAGRGALSRHGPSARRVERDRRARQRTGPFRHAFVRLAPPRDRGGAGRGACDRHPRDGRGFATLHRIGTDAAAGALAEAAATGDRLLRRIVSSVRPLEAQTEPDGDELGSARRARAAAGGGNPGCRFVQPDPPAGRGGRAARSGGPPGASSTRSPRSCIRTGPRSWR